MHIWVGRNGRKLSMAMMGAAAMLLGGAECASGQGIAFAYVGDASTGAVADSFNPSAQPVQGSRAATGQYTVNFKGTSIDFGWVAYATAVGSTGYCNVASWANGVVAVRCWGPSGIAVDSRFMVQAYAASNDKKIGFALADQPTQASYTPSVFYANNPSGQGIVFARGGAGLYTATFKGNAGLGGTALAAAQGTTNARCRVMSWSPSGADFVASISCTDPSSNLVDAPYLVTMIPAGVSPPGVAYAWVNNGGVSGAFSYNPGGSIQLAHATPGNYTLTFNGSNPTLSAGGSIQVSGVGGTAVCQVANWSSGIANSTVSVTCNNSSGTNIDNGFTVLYIPPQPLVTVTTTVQGPTVVIADGLQGAAPQQYWWVPGTQHTISVPSPMLDSGNDQKRYNFVSWSDGGAQQHTVTAPSTPTTYQAALKVQYHLTVTSSGSGTAGPAGWYDAGSTVQLTATPASGNFFWSWSGSGLGSYTGLEANRTITLNEPVAESAIFQATPLTSVRVWCGSDLNYVDTNLHYWYPDGLWSGNTGKYAVGANIVDTGDPALYQKERFAATGNLTYSFTLANGPALVRLKFAEIYFTKPGQRVFHVLLNGTQVATNFDIVAAAGASNTAVDLVRQVQISGSSLTVTLVPVTSVPKVSAIEVVPAGTLPVTVSPSAARVTGVSGIQQFSANEAVNWSISPNIGSIDSNGLYTRPAVGTFNPGQIVVVTATSQADATQKATAVLSLGTVITDADIGGVNVGGSTTQAPGDAARTVSGSGDVYGTADAFRYSYEAWSGDGAITARYSSASACCINPTKAGVMFRASTAPDAPHAFMAIYSGIVGLLETRTTQGGTTSATFGGAGAFWVKLVRRGNVFSGYISAEGVSWIPVGSATIAMPPSILVGFATSSGNGPLHTAVFDNISIDKSTVTVSVDQTLVSVAQGQQVQFTATVSGVSNTNVTWSLSPSGYGTIDANTGLYTAPALLLGPYSVTVTATSVADPTKAATVTMLLGQFAPVRVNAGGPTHIDPLGVFWNADTGSTVGNVYSAGHTISNSQTPYLYQTERFNGSAPLTYTFNVPAGKIYTVRLKFAEVYFTQAGQRVFNIVLNGAMVTPNFDIVQAAGGPDLAFDKVFGVLAPTGVISISFTPVTSAPKVNAIEITETP